LPNKFLFAKYRNSRVHLFDRGVISKSWPQGLAAVHASGIRFMPRRGFASRNLKFRKHTHPFLAKWF
jgi:hypothetical protein